MKLIGVMSGFYNEKQYFKAYFTEPITQNGIGERVCSARQSNGFSCTLEAYNLLQAKVGDEVVPSFDQYGRIIGLIPQTLA